MIVMKSETKESVNSMPMEISIAEASSTFPGFRFSPTDEELIQYYLKKKLQGCNEAVDVIAEVDICRYEPWDLPAQCIIRSENEWFLFSPRGRKYPNGSQSKRATESGYWKATGKERVIKSGPEIVGAKRTLVFHAGRAPRGQRTEWIMHEYTTSQRSQDAMVVCRLRRNSEFHHENARTNSNSPRGNLSGGAVNLSGGEALDNNVPMEPSSNSNTSHSLEQDFPGEEDFYADIMKDDIIKLDEMLSSNNAPSPQGTAKRRLKLMREIFDEQIQLDNETVPRGEGCKKTERKLLKSLAYAFVLLVLAFLYVKVLLDLSSRRIFK